MNHNTHGPVSLGIRRISHAATSIAADASLLAASGAFVAIVVLAVGAAGLLVAGGVACSQVKLVSASVEVMGGTRDDVCSTRALCVRTWAHEARTRSAC